MIDDAVADEKHPNEAKPRRGRLRWLRPRLRLSVRWLMILVLVFGVSLGWFARRIRIQRDAIALITRAGGSLLFDDQVDDNGINRPIADRVRPAWQRGLMRVFGDDSIRTPRVLFLGRVPDAATWQAVLALPELTVVELSQTNLDDARLADLVRFRRLVFLGIAGNGRITRKGMASLGQIFSLRAIDLRFNPIDDAGLASLRGLSQLRVLQLGGTLVTDAGMVHLDAFPLLEGLELGMTFVGDAGLPPLRSLHHLRSLDLGSTQVTDAGLRSLSGLTNLESLGLANLNVGDPGLEFLPQWSKLTHLQLTGTQVSDASMPRIQALTRIESLSLEGSQIRPEAIEAYKAAHPLVPVN